MTGRSYEHRRAWVEERLLFLAEHFSLDIYAYAVMSNHYHIVVRLDPSAIKLWSDEEVAYHWLAVHPSGSAREKSVDERVAELRVLLSDEEKLAKCRERLSSLSWFMRCINYPIACRANREDKCRGHFWEGRFKSIALLDESAVLACMAYVDLNPVRADSQKVFTKEPHTSIARRIATQEQDSRPLESISSGRGLVRQGLPSIRLPVSLAQYKKLLWEMSASNRNASESSLIWKSQVLAMSGQYRAYGCAEKVNRWAKRLGQNSIRCDLDIRWDQVGLTDHHLS